MDRWLLRPRSIVLRISTFQFEARKIGRVLQGLIVLVISSSYLDLDLRAVAWICFGVAGGVLFFTGVVMAGAASEFWTLGHTSELQNMLTYGGSAALSYPVSAYSRWFRRVVTYATPLAFVNYFPAISALNRTSEAGRPPLGARALADRVPRDAGCRLPPLPHRPTPLRVDRYLTQAPFR